MDVLALLADGLAQKEIAIRLRISNTTVITYITRIYEKLHVPNAPSAINQAHRLGLLHP
jgi:DNA-binding CsgD family transcriptional regulator